MTKSTIKKLKIVGHNSKGIEKSKAIANVDKDIYGNIYEYAKFSLDLEDKREQSLISQSNSMLTAFSISTGVLLIVYQIVVKDKSLPIVFINSVVVICMLLFIASMILSLLVSWRYKYKSFPAPSNMMNHILANKEYFITQEQRDKSFTQTLDEVWISKNNLNNKRANLIKASMTVYFIAIGIAVIATFVVLILQTF